MAGVVLMILDKWPEVMQGMTLHQAATRMPDKPWGIRTADEVTKWR